VDDARADGSALAALDDPDADVAAAALAVLRGRLTAGDGVRALDAVTRLALDTARSARIRQAAVDALAELPRDLIGPVLDAARATLAGGVPPPEMRDPIELQQWITAHGPAAPLSTLHDLIAGARARAGGDGGQRPHWMAARGAAHAVLARRGSRVALYDLREAFDETNGPADPAPLPLDFLSAAGSIGDASCLEPMARAWAAAPEEAWWRDHLAEAARAIVRRERIGGRSAVLRRLRTSWPEFL
jgi:hypothetical protein